MVSPLVFKMLHFFYHVDFLLLIQIFLYPPAFVTCLLTIAYEFYRSDPLRSGGRSGAGFRTGSGSILPVLVFDFRSAAAVNPMTVAKMTKALAFLPKGRRPMAARLDVNDTRVTE